MSDEEIFRHKFLVRTFLVDRGITVIVGLLGLLSISPGTLSDQQGLFMMMNFYYLLGMAFPVPEAYKFMYMFHAGSLIASASIFKPSEMDGTVLPIFIIIMGINVIRVTVVPFIAYRAFKDIHADEVSSEADSQPVDHQQPDDNI